MVGACAVTKLSMMVSLDGVVSLYILEDETLVFLVTGYGS